METELVSETPQKLYMKNFTDKTVDSLRTKKIYYYFSITLLLGLLSEQNINKNNSAGILRCNDFTPT